MAILHCVGTRISYLPVLSGVPPCLKKEMYYKNGLRPKMSHALRGCLEIDLDNTTKTSWEMA